MRPGSNEGGGGRGGGTGRGRVDRLKNRNAHVKSRRSVRRERRRIMMEYRGRWWCECAWMGETCTRANTVAMMRGGEIIREGRRGVDGHLFVSRRAVTGFPKCQVEFRKYSIAKR